MSSVLVGFAMFSGARTRHARRRIWYLLTTSPQTYILLTESCTSDAYIYPTLVNKLSCLRLQRRGSADDTSREANAAVKGRCRMPEKALLTAFFLRATSSAFAASEMGAR